MKTRNGQREAYTLVEILITTGIVSVIGLVVFSMLSSGMLLGAKNTAMNTAHQQARNAILRMSADLHSSVSLPSLIDANGNIITLVAGAASPPAAGVAFQLYSIGPLRVASDCTPSGNSFQVQLPASITTAPVAGQRLIIPTHGVEEDIQTVAVVSAGLYQLTLAKTLQASADARARVNAGASNANEIKGAASNNIVCFITDRYAYRAMPDGSLTRTSFFTFVNGTLTQNSRTTNAKLAYGVGTQTPFSTPQTQGAASPYDYRSAEIALSTADPKYNKRGGKSLGYDSSNILINGRLAIRARLSTSQ